MTVSTWVAGILDSVSYIFKKKQGEASEVGEEAWKEIQEVQQVGSRSGYGQNMLHMCEVLQEETLHF